MKKWFLRIGSTLLVLVLAVGGYAYYQMRSRGFWKIPDFETEAPTIPELKHPAVLVFSKTNSFIHKEAIPAAETMFSRMAEKNHWSIYITRNGAVHNRKDLARFDVIVWNNVTGNVLTAEQRQAMKDYIEGGGAWLGLHASGDSSRDWPWYTNTLIGSTFIGHPFNPQFQQADVVVEKPVDPIMSHLSSPWKRTDEWYSFADSPRKHGATVLATVDEKTYSPVFFNKNIGMGSDHPVVWKRCVGKGRAFYSAMGHTAESYQEDANVTMLEHAVKWLIGSEPGPC